MQKEEILERVRSNVLERIADQIEASLLPSVHIQAWITKIDKIEIGASRFGGPPDLPKEQAWPMKDDIYLAFLAQIRLKDVAPFPGAEILPDSGLLSFFYDAEEQPFGAHDQHGGWRVLYTSEAQMGALAQRDAPPLQPRTTTYRKEPRPYEVTFPACSLAFEPACSLPGWDSTYINWDSTYMKSEDWTKAEGSAYWKLLPGLGGRRRKHLMFGHPLPVQNDVQLETQANSTDSSSLWDEREKHLPEIRQWKLLLQLDSDNRLNWLWGDMGRLYFMAKESDLQARRFEDVWLIMQCS